MTVPVFHHLASTCDFSASSAMAAVVKTESNAWPFSIGVVGGRLVRQPVNAAEAVATARALEAAGWNFSLGTAQINRYNLARHGLDYVSAFDPCASVRAGTAILSDCYTRALPRFRDEQAALRAAFSCYYSGNFRTGFIPDAKGKPSYVEKVVANAQAPAPIAVVPTRTGLPTVKPLTRRAEPDQPVASSSASLSPPRSATDLPAWDVFRNFSNPSQGQ